jgi:hypothetical protein
MKIFQLNAYFLLLCFTIVSTACQLQPKKKTVDANNIAVATETAKYTQIQWIDSVKQLGTLTKGDKAEIRFQFTNTGNKPLYIISAQQGCGCTIADYPREAIAPGANGTIIAGFDTEHQMEGDFKKSILVTTNTIGKQSYDLIFTGEIKAKP